MDVRKLIYTPENIKFLFQKFRDSAESFSDELPDDIVAFTIWLGTMPVVMEFGSEDAPIGVLLFDSVTPGLGANCHVLLWDKSGEYKELLKATRIALAAVMKAHKLMRVTCLIPEFNARTQIFAKHVGFKKEGHIRCATLKDGQPIDALIYGLLREDLDVLE